MKGFLAFLLGIGTAVACIGSYSLGSLDKQNEIMYNCRDYGKHVTYEGTWQITCNGPYNPVLLIPEYKPYSQEDKNEWRKFRK